MKGAWAVGVFFACALVWLLLSLIPGAGILANICCSARYSAGCMSGYFAIAERAFPGFVAPASADFSDHPSRGLL